jgi:hypothetical protein
MPSPASVRVVIRSGPHVAGVRVGVGSVPAKASIGGSPLSTGTSVAVAVSVTVAASVAVAASVTATSGVLGRSAALSRIGASSGP